VDWKSVKTIAVVGVSNKPDRDSHMVAKYLINAGFEVMPVNPRIDAFLGIKAYPDLLAIPSEKEIDIVNIFRKSSEVLPVVEEAVKIGAKAVWMQLGIINEEAAHVAKKAGLEVVMNKCIKVVHACEK